MLPVVYESNEKHRIRMTFICLVREIDSGNQATPSWQVVQAQPETMTAVGIR
jgi:hypothetical protein